MKKLFTLLLLTLFCCSYMLADEYVWYIGEGKTVTQLPEGSTFFTMTSSSYKNKKDEWSIFGVTSTCTAEMGSNPVLSFTTSGPATVTLVQHLQTGGDKLPVFDNVKLSEDDLIEVAGATNVRVFEFSTQAGDHTLKRAASSTFHLCYIKVVCGPSTLATPEITVNQQTGAVTIAGDANASAIRYTLDGTEPSAENGNVYDGSFNLAAPGVTVKAIALGDGENFRTSEVATVTATGGYAVTYGNYLTNWNIVKAYMWRNDGATEDDRIAGWPGVTMTAPAEGDELKNWTLSFYNAWAPEKVIFNNGEESQTDNLEFVNNSVYGSIPAEYTVYYDATNSGWENVTVYLWNGSNVNAQYPGESMTKGEDGIFLYTLSSFWAPTNVIFTNGGSDKTGDLGFVNEKVYDDASAFAGWWVNVGHPIGNGDDWDWDGVQPIMGVSTKVYENGISGQFKIKVWNGTEDIYRGNGEQIALGEWINLSENGDNMTFPEATATRRTTVEFDCSNFDLRITVDPIELQAPVINVDSKYMVTIEGNENAQVYYTLDGTEPSAENGEEYTEPFRAKEGAVVKAIAVPTNPVLYANSTVAKKLVHIHVESYAPTAMWTPEEVDSYDADAVLLNDDCLEAVVVFGGKTTESYHDFGYFNFPRAFQVRVAADPSASNPNGTQQSNCSSISLNVKKDIVMTFFYRRQANSATFSDNDGKDMKVYSKNDYKAVSGNLKIVEEFEANGLYGQAYKVVELPAGEYVVAARGTTLNLYGFNYHVEAEETITIGWDNKDGWEAPHVHYSIDNGLTYTKKAMTAPAENKAPSKVITRAINDDSEDDSADYSNTWTVEIPANATHVTFSDGINPTIARTYVGDEIAQSTRFDGSDITTGVDKVEAATDAPVYYNMQGVRVVNPQNGVFIVVRGSKVTKEVVR